MKLHFVLALSPFLLWSNPQHARAQQSTPTEVAIPADYRTVRVPFPRSSFDCTSGLIGSTRPLLYGSRILADRAVVVRGHETPHDKSIWWFDIAVPPGVERDVETLKLTGDERFEIPLSIETPKEVGDYVTAEP